MTGHLSSILILVTVAVLLLVTALSATTLTAQEARGSIPDLILSSDGPGEIVVSWGTPDPESSDFRISWAPAGEDYPKWNDADESGKGNAYPPGSARSYTVKVLTPGADHKVRIRARYNADQYADDPWSGPWREATTRVAGSADSAPTPTRNPAPTSEPTPEPTPRRRGSVSGLALTSDAPGQLSMTWDAPTDAIPDDYRVNWAKVGEDFPSWRSTRGNAYPKEPVLVLDDLERGAEYKVRMRARFEQDAGSPWSGPWITGQHVVSVLQAPPAPTGLAATLNNGDVALSWDDPPEIAEITSHQVLRGTDADNLATLVENTGSADSVHTDTTHEPGQTYIYAVNARNSAGLGDASGSVTITTLAPPGGLTAVVGGSGVTLSWNAPSGATVTGYQILRGQTADRLTILTTDIDSASTSYADSSEQGPGPVQYAVRALTSLGSTGLSDTVSVVIPESTDPTTSDVVLISNVETPRAAEPASVGTETVAQAFRTGTSSQGYLLETVRLELSSQSGSPVVTVSINADGGGSYGAKLYDLTPPENLDAAVDVYTAPDNTVLDANTIYWLVIRREVGSKGEASLQMASGTATDELTIKGFTLPRQLVAGGRSRNNGNNRVRLTMTGQDQADVPASNATQETIRVGQRQEGKIDFYRDRDWYRVQLEANTKYGFDIKPNFNAVIHGVYDADEVVQTITLVNRYSEWADEARAYFTPTVAGTYYVSVGVRGKVEATYHVSVFEADPETETTATKARVRAGGAYHGEFFPPHSGLTDTDWIRVSMVQGQKYLLLLSGYMVTVDFRMLNIRDSSGAVVSGFTAVGSDRDRAGDGYSSWVTTIFEPTASGNYFVEVTARAANHMKDVITARDSDGFATAGTQTLTDWGFYGATYRFQVWSDDQASKSELSGTDTTRPHVFTPGHVATHNAVAVGAINSPDDEDWYTVWLENGRDYLVMLGGGPELTGIREWPKPSLDVFGDPKGAIAKAEPTSKCAFATYNAKKDGIHFIGAKGQATGDYSLSALDTGILAGGSADTDVPEAGGCAIDGILRHGASVRRQLFTSTDAKSYIVWLDAGARYRIDLTGADAGDGTLPDPDLFLLNPDGTLDQSAVNVGTGNDDQWEHTVTQSGFYLAWVGSDSGATGTYTIELTRIAVIWEPGPKDLMLDDDRSAGLLTTGRSLNGYLLESDSYDGFRIETTPERSYHVKIKSRDSEFYTYSSLRGRIYRYDGTTYTLLDDSRRSSGDHYRDYSVNLKFDTTTPPEGTTYTYHGVISAFGHDDGEQYYIGGYSITLTEEEISDTHVSFGSASYNAIEGGADATVAVTLSRAPDSEVLIPLTVSYNGGATIADHSTIPTTLTFGAADTTKTFTVTATDDGDDDDESITIAFDTLPDRYIAGGTTSTTVFLMSNDQVDIEGKTVSGETLTVLTTDITDPDGLGTPTYSYQWKSDGSNINGAVNGTYMLVDGDVGKRISVQVSFDDAEGNSETRVSPQTARVAGAIGLLVGSTQVSGTENHLSRVPSFSSGFVTGANAAGYLVSEAKVRFSNNATVQSANIPIDQHSSRIMTANASYHPQSLVKALHNTASITRGATVSYRAPNGTKLNPETKYSLVLQETGSGSWSCVTTNAAGEDPGTLTGWDLDRNIHHVDSNFAVTSTTASSKCRLEIRGRALVAGVPYLNDLAVTNAPADGTGFETGEVIQITATFSAPVVGTLHLPLGIGTATVNLAATNGDGAVSSFVFTHTVASGERDTDGVAVAANTITGYVDADISHMPLRADSINTVNE